MRALIAACLLALELLLLDLITLPLAQAGEPPATPCPGVEIVVTEWPPQPCPSPTTEQEIALPDTAMEAPR